MDKHRSAKKVGGKRPPRSAKTTPRKSGKTSKVTEAAEAVRRVSSRMTPAQKALLAAGGIAATAVAAKKAKKMYDDSKYKSLDHVPVFKPGSVYTPGKGMLDGMLEFFTNLFKSKSVPPKSAPTSTSIAKSTLTAGRAGKHGGGKSAKAKLDQVRAAARNAMASFAGATGGLSDDAMDAAMDDAMAGAETEGAETDDDDSS